MNKSTQTYFTISRSNVIGCINQCVVVVVVVLLPKGVAEVTLKINGNNRGPRQLLDGPQNEKNERGSWLSFSSQPFSPKPSTEKEE